MVKQATLWLLEQVARMQRPATATTLWRSLITTPSPRCMKNARSVQQKLKTRLGTHGAALTDAARCHCCAFYRGKTHRFEKEPFFCCILFAGLRPSAWSQTMSRGWHCLKQHLRAAETAPECPSGYFRGFICSTLELALPGSFSKRKHLRLCVSTTHQSSRIIIVRCRCTANGQPSTRLCFALHHVRFFEPSVAQTGGARSDLLSKVLAHSDHSYRATSRRASKADHLASATLVVATKDKRTCLNAARMPRCSPFSTQYRCHSSGPNLPAFAPFHDNKR